MNASAFVNPNDTQIALYVICGIIVLSVLCFVLCCIGCIKQWVSQCCDGITCLCCR